MRIEYVHRLAVRIASHLRGKGSEEEEADLQRWKEASPEHEALLQRFSSLDFLESMRKEELSYAPDGAYRRFMQHIQRRKRLRRTRWMSVAALAILLLGSTLWWMKPTASEEAAGITCGTSLARLTLADGQVIPLEGSTTRLLESGGIAVKVADGQIAYTGGEGQGAENVLEIPRKGEFQLMLGDGTRVWLNAETDLRYPSSFGQGNREVHLKGEAYFEVAPDPQHPFIVRLGEEQKVVVTGTAFNVHSYPDETYSYTTLASGSVEVYAGMEKLCLSPGEQAVLHPDRRTLEKREVNAGDYIAWKNERFVFKKQRLEDIMNSLARWYDVEVHYQEEAAREVTFSGNLERYDQLDQILKMLEMTQRTLFRVEGRKVYVRMNNPIK